MKHFEFEWQTADRLRLFAQGWQPQTRIQGVVCLVHGLGDHSGWYTHVATALTRAGYVFLCYDLRGHGRSQGKRGHTPSYEALMDDISHLLEEATRRYPNQPRFLYGNSMGGNLVLNYVLRLRPQLAGVICTSPLLRLVFEPPTWEVTLARITNKVWPALSLSSGEDTKALSRDPEVVLAYETDPLIHDRISVRWFVGMNQAAKWALQHADQFPIPLLLMHGGADRTTSADASRQFANHVPGDCTYKLWEGFYHDIVSEPERQQVFDYLIAWLQAHTPTQSVEETGSVEK